jgi:protein phosphatase PTC7
MVELQLCTFIIYFVCVCVLSGVGSWRQYGIDPRNYAHKLVDNAKQAVELNYQLWKGTDGDVGALLGFSNDIGRLPIHPLDVIIDAWNASTDAEVTGSSTICVATLDGERNQLSYSNLGDCGLVVVRHIDSETAGYMVISRFPISIEIDSTFHVNNYT